MSLSYAAIESLEAALATLQLISRETPRPALCLAAKAYLRYRRAGGTRRQVLPDFFIGAHAAVEGWPLLTRDAARFRSYFPTVQVIAP